MTRLVRSEPILAVSPFDSLTPVIAVSGHAAPSFVRATTAIEEVAQGHQGCGRLASVAVDTPARFYGRDAAGRMMRGWWGQPAVLTNKQTYSEDASHYYAGTLALITDPPPSDTVIAPDGTVSGDTFHETSAGGSHRLATPGLLSLTNTKKYFYGCFWRPGRRDRVYQYATDYTKLPLKVTCRLSTLQVTNLELGLDAGVIEYSDNWFLTWAFGQAAATASVAMYQYLIDEAGASGFVGQDWDSLFRWGMTFCEVTDLWVPMYIPNTAASTTARNADPVVTYTNPMPDQRQGHVSVDVMWRTGATGFVPAADIPILDVSDGGADTDRVRLAAEASTGYLKVTTASTGGNAGSVTVAVKITDGKKHRLSCSWVKNQLVAWVDGSPSTPDTSCDFSAAMDQVDMHPIGGCTGELALFGWFRARPWLGSLVRSVDSAEIVLPSAVYAQSGVALNVYDGEVVGRYHTDVPTVDSPTGGTHTGKVFTITPSGVADISLSASHGTSHAAATVKVAPASPSYSTKRYILCVGDSLTAAANTWVDDLMTLLGTTYWETVGLVATTGGNLCEGHSGQDYHEFCTEVASPFTDGAGALDVASYLASLGNSPDIVIFLMGINDVFVADPDGSTLASLLAQMRTYAAIMHAAFRAQLPNVEIVEAIPPAGTFSQPLFHASYGLPGFSQNDWKRNWMALARSVMERSSTNTVVHAGLEVDPIVHYDTSAVHPSATGYEQIARQVHSYLAWRYGS